MWCVEGHVRVGKNSTGMNICRRPCPRHHAACYPVTRRKARMSTKWMELYACSCHAYFMAESQHGQVLYLGNHVHTYM